MRNGMNLRLSVGCTACLGVFAWLLAAGAGWASDPASPGGAELTDAKEVLKKADEAVRKVGTVSYSATAKSTGWLESRAPSAEGTAVLSGKGKTQQDMAKFLIKVKSTPPGSSEPVEITGGSDGETFFLIDPATKTVYEDIDPAVMGKNMRLIQGLMARCFTLEEPFADELKAEKVELRDSVKVGDDDCYQVAIPNPNGQGESIWYFAKKDFLPRRRDRIMVNPAGEKGSREVNLADLKVDPALEGNPFKAVTPEGFKKTDDFAP